MGRTMGEEGTLSPSAVLAVLSDGGCDAASFSHLSYVDCKYKLIAHLQAQGRARDLSTSERRCVSSFVNLAQLGVSSMPAQHSSSRATVLMSYTDNYRLGTLTTLVNAAYAEKHGYTFRLHKKPYAEMMADIAPRDNPTWHKVKAINDELLQSDSTESAAEYVLWLDADAIVVDHELKLDDVARACGWRDLVISEDLHAGSSCIVNAGVMLVKKSAFSRKLFGTMWAEHTKYDRTIYYEQSALQQQLRKMGQGLENVRAPFFSAEKRACSSGTDGTLAALRRDCLRFPHCTVAPCHLLNTNVYRDGDPRGPAARFVFHAAGRGKTSRIFWDVIEQRGLMTDELFALRSREDCAQELNNVDKWHLV